MSIVMSTPFRPELLDEKALDGEEETEPDIDEVRAAAVSAVKDLLTKPKAPAEEAAGDSKSVFWEKVAKKSPYTACVYFFEELNSNFLHEACTLKGNPRENFEDANLFLLPAMLTFSAQVEKMDAAHPLFAKQAGIVRLTHSNLPEVEQEQKVTEYVKGIKERVTALAGLVILATSTREQIEELGIDYFEFVSKKMGEITGYTTKNPDLGDNLFEEAKGVLKGRRKALGDLSELTTQLEREDEAFILTRAGINAEVFAHASLVRASKLLTNPEVLRKYPEIQAAMHGGVLAGVEKTDTTLDKTANADFAFVVRRPLPGMPDSITVLGLVDVQCYQDAKDKLTHADLLAETQPYRVTIIYKDRGKNGVTFDGDDAPEGGLFLSKAEIELADAAKTNPDIKFTTSLRTAQRTTSLRVAKFVMDSGQPIIVLKTPTSLVGPYAKLTDVVKAANSTDPAEIDIILGAMNTTLKWVREAYGTGI